MWRAQRTVQRAATQRIRTGKIRRCGYSDLNRPHPGSDPSSSLTLRDAFMSSSSLSQQFTTTNSLDSDFATTSAASSNSPGLPPPPPTTYASSSSSRMMGRQRLPSSSSNNNNNNNNSPLHNKNDEDLRYLYHALRAFSTYMPQTLVAINRSDNGDGGEAQQDDTARSSWRDANVLKGYKVIRRPTSWKSSYLANRSAAAMEEDHVDDDDDADAENDHEDDQENDMGDDPLAAYIITEQQQEENVVTPATNSPELVASPARVPGLIIEKDMQQAAKHAVPNIMKPLPTSATQQQQQQQQHVQGATTNTTEQAMEDDTEALIKDLETQLVAAVRGYRRTIAIRLFETATVEHGVVLDLKLVLDMYELLVESHPFHSYQIMQYILQRTNSCTLFVPVKHQKEQPPPPPPQQRQQQQQQINEDPEDENNTLNSHIEASNSDSQESPDLELVGHLYERMCFAMRQMDPHKHRHNEIRSLASSMISELKQLDPIIQRKCLPVLVLSLVTQRSHSVGIWAQYFYQIMVDLEYDMSPDYFQQLLLCSKFNRSADIPYHDALQQAVRGGLRPLPHIVLNVVENMFPYTDNVRATFTAMECVVQLEQQSKQLLMEQEAEVMDMQRKIDDENFDEQTFEELEKKLSLMRPPDNYILDVSSVEYMAIAAVRKKHVELILLLWDYLDVTGLEATETIYESTVLCFAQQSRLVENAFVVMKDMEDAGFVPTQSLVKGAALALRSNEGCAKRAKEVLGASLAGDSDAIPITQSGLNVLMSANAWKGDVEGCLSLLTKAAHNGLPLDADSFSSALESVGKACKHLLVNKTARISPFKKHSILDGYVEAAETILAQLEDTTDKDLIPLVPNHNFVRNYVEFLCLLDQVKTASMVVTDFLGQDHGTVRIVDNKILARVAVANAEAGDFETARKFCVSMSDSLPFLEAKIDKIEAAQQMSQTQDVSLVAAFLGSKD